MSKQAPFEPYANEAEVLHVGALAIENRLDRVSISGVIDLTADQAGLSQARALHALLGDIVAALEARDLPASLPAGTVTTVDNPFT